MAAKLLHMCVGVSDLAGAESFYLQALGLEVKDRYSGPDGWTVSLLSNPQSRMELELVAWADGKLRQRSPGQDIHLGVVVDDLEAEHARLAKFAAAIEPIVDHLVDGRPFARYFFVRDPDGNRIEFLECNVRYC